jgi:DNA-binding NtrC family response regulator
LEDVSGLVLYFCHKLGTEKSFTPDALERLRSYCWKGNVRELENFVERVAVLCDDAAITSDDVVRHLSREARKLSTFNLTKFENDVSLREVKNLHVQAVLQKCDGNKSMAARILGINVKTLYSILKVIGGKNF